MAQVTILPDRLSTVMMTPQYGGRDPGVVHVSDCIKHLLTTLDPGTYGSGAQSTRFAAEDTVRLEMGMAWEEVLGQAISRNALKTQADAGHLYVRPGPMSKDGIVGTPDIVDLDEPTPVVEEWKATWMSCRDVAGGDPAAILTTPKFWKWLIQLKAYCSLMDTPHGRLRALFVNGDYSRGPGAALPPFCPGSSPSPRPNWSKTGPCSTRRPRQSTRPGRGQRGKPY